MLPALPLHLLPLHLLPPYPPRATPPIPLTQPPPENLPKRTEGGPGGEDRPPCLLACEDRLRRDLRVWAH